METIDAIKQYASSNANEGTYIFKKKETEELDLLEMGEILFAYPNPFNPSTKILYQILQSGLVTLKVYNILGEEVVELVNEYKTAGKYLINFNGANLPSGMYIYWIQNGDYYESKKLLLLK